MAFELIKIIDSSSHPPPLPLLTQHPVLSTFFPSTKKSPLPTAHCQLPTANFSKREAVLCKNNRNMTGDEFFELVGIAVFYKIVVPDKMKIN